LPCPRRCRVLGAFTAISALSPLSNRHDRKLAVSGAATSGPHSDTVRVAVRRPAGLVPASCPSGQTRLRLRGRGAGAALPLWASGAATRRVLSPPYRLYSFGPICGTYSRIFLFENGRPDFCYTRDDRHVLFSLVQFYRWDFHRYRGWFGGFF